MMRIAEVSTLFRPVPPPGEGSVESIVHLITEGLVKRGHEVTLFAVADSRTSARLRSPVEVSYTADAGKWDWQLYEAYQVSRVFREASQFDLIHCHSYHFGLLFCDMVTTPTLHSIHIEPGPDYRFLAERTHNRWIHFSSKYQARGFGDVPRAAVVPFGVDLSRYHVAPEPERDDYLLFLGRFIPGKGPLQAIELARKAGVPLKLAAPENEYYREVIEPRVDGQMIQYVGEVRGQEKADLLARARALVYPIQDAEPFGLVLLEALASGLPVLALDRGSVPEIVTPGLTGFLARNLEDLVVGLEVVDRLDRGAIRREAEMRFSQNIMVGRLEQWMLRIIGEATI